MGLGGPPAEVFQVELLPNPTAGVVGLLRPKNT